MTEKIFDPEAWKLWKRFAFLWVVPTQVAVTAALAQGGAFTNIPGVPPLGAAPFDQPTLRTGLVIPAGGTLAILLPAVGPAKRGAVTALGLDTSDVANTRYTTRVNGAAVAPEIAAIGPLGTGNLPVPLAAPILENPGDVFSLFIENLNGGAPITINAVRILGYTA